ncbi:MAG TPA: pitrilysin family protein [Dehalococcoidia bacterium]|nr:pitrilysin family protein [Dehalococcoidia bacterium]
MAHIHTFDNGLRLVATAVAHARSVSISVYLRAGARYELPDDAGLSHFAEHLCFKGTERRPLPQDIAVEIDSMGGTINAITDRELTVYYAKVTPDYAGQALDVLSDMIRNSLYHEPEIERERGVILEELAASEDSPAEQSGLLLDRLLWPGQPLGRDIAGTPATVSAISPQRLVEYYQTQYVANATVISIAGAIDEQETAELVERALGDWGAGEPAALMPHEDEPRGDRVGTIAKETEQVHISFGMRSTSYFDEDRHAVDLLSILLGEGMSSRLFARLREELGLCYDIHTFVSHLSDTGMFGVYAGVDPGKAREAVCEIAAELKRARDPVTPEELGRAQRLVRSRLQLRMEDTHAVSAWHGSQEVLDLPRLTPEQSIARADAVTVEDIERAAARLITDDGLHVALAGPVDGESIMAGVSVDG